MSLFSLSLCLFVSFSLCLFFSFSLRLFFSSSLYLFVPFFFVFLFFLFTLIRSFALSQMSTGRSDDTLPALLNYEPLRLMIPLLYPHFPPEYTEAYLIKNPKAYRPQKQGSLGYVAATSTSLLISGLCTNVMIYVALLLSPAREDESGKAAAAFKMIALVRFSFVSCKVFFFFHSYII